MAPDDLVGLRARTAVTVAPAVCLVAAVWAVGLANWLLGRTLERHGVVPRTLDGLDGIVWAPFLHADLAHLASNTLPLLVLGALVGLRGTRTFVAVLVVVTVVGGLGVWLLGRPAAHVGASGVIFGFFGFLIASAWFTRSLSSAVVAAVTVALYSGLIWGVVPRGGFVSWEGHLFGLLAGIAAARWLPRAPRAAR
jgi:membrane associated rhomboid family serine protease